MQKHGKAIKDGFIKNIAFKLKSTLNLYIYEHILLTNRNVVSTEWSALLVLSECLSKK